MKALVIAFAFALLGCMPSADPRTADYTIAHDSLRPNVAFAIAVWQAAGAGLDWREQPCTGEPRACVRFRWDDSLPSTVAGRTLRTSTFTDASVLISTGTAHWYVNEVTAHEMGHVLGMDHVMHEPIALMRPMAVGAWCIGDATRQEWALTWGTPLGDVCSGEITVGRVIR